MINVSVTNESLPIQLRSSTQVIEAAIQTVGPVTVIASNTPASTQAGLMSIINLPDLP